MWRCWRWTLQYNIRQVSIQFACLGIIDSSAACMVRLSVGAVYEKVRGKRRLPNNFGNVHRFYISFENIVDGPQPAVLQKVTVPIWTNAQCRVKYGSAAPGNILYVNYYMVGKLRGGRTTDTEFRPTRNNRWYRGSYAMCWPEFTRFLQRWQWWWVIFTTWNLRQKQMKYCEQHSLSRYLSSCAGPLMVSDGSSWSQIGVVSWGIGKLFKLAHIHICGPNLAPYLQTLMELLCHCRMWTGSLSRRLCTNYVLLTMDREKQADRINAAHLLEQASNWGFIFPVQKIIYFAEHTYSFLNRFGCIETGDDRRHNAHIFDNTQMWRSKIRFRMKTVNINVRKCQATVTLKTRRSEF